MSLVNIRRDNKDPFYRYKMPLLISKIEGRGNGIRTAIVNTSDVARSLSRPPSYVIKFFGFELGAQTSISEASDRYIVNGAHDAPKLQDLLDVFISKFVLCSACKNPETDIILLKDGNLTRDCKACGQRSLIDPRHKLSSFITKNPPSTAKGKKKAATASAHVGGGAPLTINGVASTSNEGSGGEDSGNGDNNGTPDEENNSDDELTRRINAEASTLPELKHSNDDDDNWAADMSEEAIRARQKELEKSLAVLNLDDDDEEGDSAAYVEFGEWVEESRDDVSDVDIYKKAVELSIATRHRTVQVLAQALFTDDIVSEIEEHEGLLAKLTQQSKNHEKALLGGIERLVGLQYPEKIKQIPNILSELYHNEIISKEVIMKWGSRASKKYVDKEVSKKVRKASKPFLEFLENEESDSSDEE